jgi:hypothetical protein
MLRDVNRDRDAAMEDQGASADGANGPHHTRRNLMDEFNMVGDQPVHRTPSANIAVAFNKLDKLGQTPEIEKIHTYLMAVKVQVNDICSLPPSHSTA